MLEILRNTGLAKSEGLNKFITSNYLNNDCIYL